jgi:Predicted ATP-dependent endonuclease of the OLD family
MKKKAKVYKQKTAQMNMSVREGIVDYSSSTKTPMLNYTSVEINNFRCIKNLCIEELGRVNVIAGINNVGKTTLLESLFLQIGNTNPSLALLIDSFRGLNILQEISGSRWRTLFWQFQETNPIKIISRNSKGSHRSLTITLIPTSTTTLETIKTKGEVELVESLGKDLVFAYKEGTKKPVEVVGTPIVIKKGDIVQVQLNIQPSPPPLSFPGIFISSRHQGNIREDTQRFSDLRVNGQDEPILLALKS